MVSVMPPYRPRAMSLVFSAAQLGAPSVVVMTTDVTSQRSFSQLRSTRQLCPNGDSVLQESAKDVARICKCSPLIGPPDDRDVNMPLGKCGRTKRLMNGDFSGRPQVRKGLLAARMAFRKYARKNNSLSQQAHARANLRIRLERSLGARNPARCRLLCTPPEACGSSSPFTDHLTPPLYPGCASTRSTVSFPFSPGPATPNAVASSMEIRQ